MALTVQTVEYFYARIAQKPEKAYELLAQLAREEISLLAFSAVPFGSHHVELTLFPDNPEHMLSAGKKLGWDLTGPQHAVLIQGDDHLGALADIHQCLDQAGVRVYASSGVTDGAGHFGYVIYFMEDDHLEAARALATVAIKG